MADVFWAGKQRRRAMVRTFTVTTADTGGTITINTGGTKTVPITPTTTGTTLTATELAAACAASTEPEFTEITWTSSGAVVTATGPDDGRPITVTVAVTGSNAVTAATAVTAQSPNDFADAANYAGGALPVNLDRVVFQNGSVPVLWNLNGLPAVTFTILRKDTYTGSIGLPDRNANGYPEYRATHLETAGATIEVEGSSGDYAGQFRFKSNAGSAVTFTARYGKPSAYGQEVVEIHNTPASSVYRLAGASVAIAPTVGQTATVGTLTASNATLRIGPGVTLGSVNGPTLQGVTAVILSSWSNSLTLDGGTVEVGGAAAGSFTIEGGTIAWRSTGNPGATLVVGSGGKLDLSQAPGTLTLGGTISAYEGSTVDDRNGRGGNYSLNPVHCTLADINWIVSNNRTFAMS